MPPALLAQQGPSAQPQRKMITGPDGALVTTGGQPQSRLSQSLIRRKEARSIKPDFHPQWKLMRVISGHLGWVRAVSVEPGNSWFATGAGDRMIKVRF